MENLFLVGDYLNNMNSFVVLICKKNECMVFKMKIKLGIAGSQGYKYEEIFKLLKESGLNALEVAFTYGVRMKKEDALVVGKLAKEYGISLSVHGPYYINLASKEDNERKDRAEK